MDESKAQANSDIADAKAIEKATEVLEGAYEGLEKAEAFAKAALERKEAAIAKAQALRESRRKKTPAPAPVAQVDEVNPYQHLI